MSTPAWHLYFPALHGKAGEMKALKNTSAPHRLGMVPIVDFPIAAGSDRKEVESALTKLADKLTQGYDATHRIIIDTHLADGVKINGQEALQEFHREIRSHVTGIPVVTPRSSSDYLAAVTAIAGTE